MTAVAKDSNPTPSWRSFCGHCEWLTTPATVRVVFRARAELRASYVCAEHLPAELEELRYFGWPVALVEPYAADG